jgi:hypothetical protein
MIYSFALSVYRSLIFQKLVGPAGLVKAKVSEESIAAESND